MERIIDHKKMGEIIAFDHTDWVIIRQDNQFEIYQNGEVSKFAKTLEEAHEILRELIDESNEDFDESVDYNKEYWLGETGGLER